MFTVEGFVEECRAALKDTMPEAAVRDVVARWMARPDQIARVFGTPARAGSRRWVTSTISRCCMWCGRPA